MNAVEFSRPVRLDTLGPADRAVAIAAEGEERLALAARFGLFGIDSLEAVADVRRDGDVVIARGRITAAVVQRCVATAVPLPATVASDFTLRFVPAGTPAAGAEVELSADDCDVVDYDGGAIDLGEAVAETLLLELDPFPRAPDADAVLKAAGVKMEGEEEREAGPFGALKGLLKGGD